MPRPRRANPFIDDSAQRAEGAARERAPRVRADEAKDYNDNADAYERALAPYATSARTRTKIRRVPEPAAAPAAGRRGKKKVVIAVASLPALPGNVTVAQIVRKPRKSKAELKRIADARKVAEHRRAHPGPLSYAEKLNADKLVDQGVSKLTTCFYESRVAGHNVKTANYNSKVVAMERRVLKNGTLGKQRYRLASLCRTCSRGKNTFLEGDTPDTVRGGRV